MAKRKRTKQADAKKQLLERAIALFESDPERFRWEVFAWAAYEARRLQHPESAAAFAFVAAFIDASSDGQDVVVVEDKTLPDKLKPSYDSLKASVVEQDNNVESNLTLVKFALEPPESQPAEPPSTLPSADWVPVDRAIECNKESAEDGFKKSSFSLLATWGPCFDRETGRLIATPMLPGFLQPRDGRFEEGVDESRRPVYWSKHRSIFPIKCTREAVLQYVRFLREPIERLALQEVESGDPEDFAADIHNLYILLRLLRDQDKSLEFPDEPTGAVSARAAINLLRKVYEALHPADLPILSEAASAAYEILLQQEPYRGLTGTELLSMMAERSPHCVPGQSALTTRIIPELEPYGVENAPRKGYRIPQSRRPK